MGRVSNRRKNADSKKKGFKKSRITKRRARDIDQIQDDLKHVKQGISKLVGDKVKFDEDLPGGGLFYCIESGRHFANQKALDAHRSSKRFKKRLKKLKEKQYTQEEADAAGGLQKQKYIPYGDSKQKKKKTAQDGDGSKGSDVIMS